MTTDSNDPYATQPLFDRMFELSDVTTRHHSSIFSRNTLTEYELIPKWDDDEWRPSAARVVSSGWLPGHFFGGWLSWDNDSPLDSFDALPGWGWSVCDPTGDWLHVPVELIRSETAYALYRLEKEGHWSYRKLQTEAHIAGMERLMRGEQLFLRRFSEETRQRAMKGGAK